MCPRSIWEPCPKLQIIESGPKAEGSLSTWGKVINTLKSLLEQKESFDRAEVCSVCHFAWGCFDYSGYCMGWLNSPVSTPFAWKNDQQPELSHFDRWKTVVQQILQELKAFFFCSFQFAGNWVLSPQHPHSVSLQMSVALLTPPFCTDWVWALFQFPFSSPGHI